MEIYDPLTILVQYQIDTLPTPTTGHGFIHLEIGENINYDRLAALAFQSFRTARDPNNSLMIPGTAQIRSMVVHWGVPPYGYVELAFPRTTELTAANLEAVLHFMRHSKGYDFVEIRFGSYRGLPSAIAPRPDLPGPNTFRKRVEDAHKKGERLELQVPPGLDYRS